MCKIHVVLTPNHFNILTMPNYRRTTKEVPNCQLTDPVRLQVFKQVERLRVLQLMILYNLLELRFYPCPFNNIVYAHYFKNVVFSFS